MNFSYPPKPEVQDLSFLNPSPQFKTQVYSMIGGIVAFALLYLLLIAVGIVLLVVCYYLSIGLVGIGPNLLTLAAALGLLALGVMFFLFLIKFIFSRTQEEDVQQLEIFESDYPTLFAFIRKVTEEVKTDFPKRIFLVPDVNAAVFYNSSFLSMFFPVRKNLRIGLGLVNSLTLSEFKAALAHEFGHFSQQSMALGSYVYTVNKVIFNLVTQRDRWDSLLERWANTGGVFGFFAGITFWMVNQVRTLLNYAYTKLNVRYMALSREMEYHADLVACSVAGNLPMISTLRRIEFTDNSYHYMVSQLNQLAVQRKKVRNLYPVHLLVTGFIAKQFNLSMVNNLPEITTQDLERHLIKTRLNLKDQWASHPSREEREKNINTVNLPVPTLEESAWNVFGKSQECQLRMTAHLYSVGFTDHAEMVDIPESEFMQSLEEEKKKLELPKVFNGFYDDRFMYEFDLTQAAESVTDRSFEEIFHNSNRDFFTRQMTDQNDLEQLKAIQLSVSKNDYIEFDYKKRKATEIPVIIRELEAEIEVNKQTGFSLDKHAFQFFYSRAQAQGLGAQLMDVYKQIFKWQYDTEACGKVVEELQRYHHQLATKLYWSEQEGNWLNRDLNQLEINFKIFLKTLQEGFVEKISDPEEFQRYVKGEINYMTVHTFSESGLEKLTGRIFEVFNLLQLSRFNTLKEMTTLQLQLIPEKFVQA